MSGDGSPGRMYEDPSDTDGSRSRAGESSGPPRSWSTVPSHDPRTHTVSPQKDREADVRPIRGRGDLRGGGARHGRGHLSRSRPHGSTAG